ncbi:hypothetical protein BaRGS_00036665, partial [Batillaria attramentaria]
MTPKSLTLFSFLWLTESVTYCNGRVLTPRPPGQKVRHYPPDNGGSLLVNTAPLDRTVLVIAQEQYQIRRIRCRSSGAGRNNHRLGTSAIGRWSEIPIRSNRYAKTER